MAIQICSVHTCSCSFKKCILNFSFASHTLPTPNFLLFFYFLHRLSSRERPPIIAIPPARNKCDKKSKASSRAHGGADVCFLSFAVLQQHGAGAATRWTAAAFWSGAWRGATAVLAAWAGRHGRADAEDGRSRSDAGPAWHAAPNLDLQLGRQAGKEWKQQELRQIFWDGLQICGSLLFSDLVSSQIPHYAPAVLLPLKRFSSHKL